MINYYIKFKEKIKIIHSEYIFLTCCIQEKPVKFLSFRNAHFVLYLVIFLFVNKLC